MVRSTVDGGAESKRWATTATDVDGRDSWNDQDEGQHDDQLGKADGHDDGRRSGGGDQWR